MEQSEYSIEELVSNESFISYCYGTNSKDVDFWENKLKTNPELGNNIQKAKEICLLLAIKISPAEKKFQLEKLKQAIEISENLPPKIIRMPFKVWAWVSVAASILIISAISVFQYISSNPSGATLYSQVSTSTYHLTGQTNFNERKKLRLPDGTTVIMNGSSELKLANDYNIKNRHVYLTGEAFFMVKKDHTRPFVVITDKTATTALGTSFKVESYDSQSAASTMLATGKVKVESTRLNQVDPVLLIPGEQTILNKGNTKFNKSAFSNKALQNWIDRKLVFSNSNLDDIALKFKEIYGLTVLATNTPAEQVRFTGRFDNKDPSAVLDAIGFSNHFTYKQTGNTIMLIF